MIVIPKDLPSNGIDPNSEPIEIKPLNFIELIEDTKNRRSTLSEVASFLVDYNLVKSRISNWKSISLVDLEFVIFLLKKASCSTTNEFIVEIPCSECGEVNNLVLDIDKLSVPMSLCYDVKGAIELEDKQYAYTIPNLGKFDEVLTKMQRYNKVKDIRVIYLMSCFDDFDSNPNKIENLIINAVDKDALNLFTFESMYFRSNVDLGRQCSKCKGGDWRISVRNLISSIFQCLVLSNRTTKSQIITEQIC